MWSSFMYVIAIMFGIHGIYCFHRSKRNNGFVNGRNKGEPKYVTTEKHMVVYSHMDEYNDYEL